MTLTTRISILVALATIAQTASAQNPVSFTFTGEITNIDFGPEYMNGAYTVGQTITGSVTYFDSGYRATSDIPDQHMSYEFYQVANPYGAPILNPRFTVTAGDKTIQSGPSNFETFFASVIHQGTDFGVPGDEFMVWAPTDGIPSFYNDVNNGATDYITHLVVNFANPNPEVFTSTDLPLTAPNLADFPNSTGVIMLTATDTRVLAAADFRITSVQAVPEPSTLAALTLGGLAILRRRKRQS